MGHENPYSSLAETVQDGMQSAPPPGYATTYVQSVQMTPTVQPVGPKSTIVTCQGCQRKVKTRLRRDITSRTHCWTCICFICCCPFFWVPYCCNSCRNTNHYCPECDTFIGTYKQT